MNNEQRKFLKDKLLNVGREKRESKREIPPAKVKKAQAIIDDWTEGVCKKAVERRKRIIAAERDCKEIILFGSYEDASKAIEKFSAMKF